MENTYILGPDGELYHWGVKGMKWGIRRYQNKDGSLTTAGKKRTSESNKSEAERLDRPRRAAEALSKLSGKKDNEITADEKGCFQNDVYTVLTQTYADRISSKNPSDVKEFANFINECWKYEMTITDAYVSGPNGENRELISERAKKYHDAYIKNDPEAYAKSVIEEIEYRELNHSGIDSDDVFDGEIYHHGITGMKWGVRRYQNKDGSLTPAGKKRYKSVEEELKAREKVIKNKERAKEKLAKLEAKKAELDAREKALKDDTKANKTDNTDNTDNTEEPKSKETRKNTKDMSDSELQSIVNRLRNEDAYKDLSKKLGYDTPNTELDAKIAYLKRQKEYLELQRDIAKLTPEKTTKGKQFVTKVWDKTVEPALLESGKTVIKTYLEKAGLMTVDNLVAEQAKKSKSKKGDG